MTKNSVTVTLTPGEIANLLRAIEETLKYSPLNGDRWTTLTGLRTKLKIELDRKE